MREQSTSKTAIGTAMGRAIESLRLGDDRLFEDPLAMKLLAPAQRALVRLLVLPVLGPALLSLRERQIPGIMGNLWCRTRFLDDQMQTAIAAGIEQVDLPATQAWKLERMRRIGRRGDSHVIYVAVDFERQVLGEALTARGFEPGAPTFTIWEGVTQYIGETAVDTTLRFLTGVTPRDRTARCSPRFRG